MKKKVKLFSTIASLCLAVALMAFGVMAATTETFKVTSSVSYSVTGQVDVKFEVSVQYSSDGVTAPEINSDDTTTKDDKTKVTETGLITRTFGSIEVKPGTAAKTDGYTVALGEFKFNAKATNNTTKIIYIVTITNNATEELSVKLSNVVEKVENGTIKVDPETGSSTFISGVATASKSTPVKYVVTYTLADGSQSATTLTFNPIFAVSVKG